jgi:hypothetical protein
MLPSSVPFMNKTTLKSIGAVVAGLLLIIIVSTLVDIGLHTAKIYPPVGEPMTNALALLASSYRLVIGIAGAWITARLAPARPMKHALILGAIGMVLGFVGVVATWNMGLGPRWYAVSLAVVALPQCWFGGWLVVRRSPIMAIAG